MQHPTTVAGALAPFATYPKQLAMVLNMYNKSMG